MDTVLSTLTYGQILASLGSIFLACCAFWILRPDAECAIEFIVQEPAACKSDWVGEELQRPSIKVADSTAIQCYAPASARLLGLIDSSTPDDIDRAISKATDAQLQWKTTTFSQRRGLLKTLLKFILDHQETIIAVACLDSGKTRVDALFGEILVTVEKLQWTISHGEEALKPRQRPTNFLMFYKRNEVRYEPLGVVGACVSWNYPFHNLLGPVISALFSGNAIVVKNSENTAWSSVYFIDIVRKALSACGHSPDLVHSISCWPQTAEYFTSHPGLSHLTFIGSRPVAHHIARSASKTLIPLCVELGGKDAAIVLDEPNGRSMAKREMERVSSIIMRGVFQSAGQNCIGIERVVAMPAAYDILVKMLEPRVQALRLGDDLDPEKSAHQTVDVGALISPASFARLEGLIADAVSKGARLLAGGKRYHHPRFPHGHYFTPTLIVDVTLDMAIAKQELFAPVCVLMRVGSVAEAISLTNSVEYGLGCSVFGPTSTQGGRDNLQHVTNEVKSGMVAINDFAAFYMVQLPFGGVRGSGYGRFAGKEGLRSLCNIKGVCADWMPSLIKTSIPAVLDYPMQSNAEKSARGVVEVGYGESLVRRWRGVRKLGGF